MKFKFNSIEFNQIHFNETAWGKYYDWWLKTKLPFSGRKGKTFSPGLAQKNDNANHINKIKSMFYKDGFICPTFSFNSLL